MESRRDWVLKAQMEESQKRWNTFFNVLKAVKLDTIWEYFRDRYNYPYKLASFQKSLESIREGKGALADPLMLELLLKYVDYPADRLFGFEDVEYIKMFFDDVNITERFQLQLTKKIERVIREQINFNLNKSRRKKRRIRKDDYLKWRDILLQTYARFQAFKSYADNSIPFNKAVILWNFFSDYSSQNQDAFPHDQSQLKELDELIFTIYQSFKSGYEPLYETHDLEILNSLMIGYLGWCISNYSKALFTFINDGIEKQDSIFIPDVLSAVMLKKLNDETENLLGKINKYVLKVAIDGFSQTHQHNLLYFHNIRDRLADLAWKIIYELKVEPDFKQSAITAMEKKDFFNKCLGKTDPLLIRFTYSFAANEDLPRIAEVISYDIEQCFYPNIENKLREELTAHIINPEFEKMMEYSFEKQSVYDDFQLDLFEYIPDSNAITEPGENEKVNTPETLHSSSPSDPKISENEEVDLFEETPTKKERKEFMATTYNTKTIRDTPEEIDKLFSEKESNNPS